ncbi:lipoxygenase homology domain-containing protein 1-like [Saccoglossus kowalevskii]
MSAPEDKVRKRAFFIVASFTVSTIYRRWLLFFSLLLNTLSKNCVNFPEDLGKIYKIRVWIDNSGAAPDWYLDKIVFVRLDGTIVFPCDQWFSDSKDDEQLIRELPAVYEDEDPLPLVNYNVCVKTGKRRSAGTRANVYIEIHGERGDTGRRPLDDHNYVEKDNKFVRTAIDNFVIQAVSLGDINKLVVGHDGSRRRPRWYLKRVIVTDVENEKVYFFNHRRWISEEDDDCTLEHAVEVEFEEAESSSEDEGSSSSSSSSSDDEEE